MTKPLIKTKRPMLGSVLRKWRLMNEIGMREAAQKMGIGVATLCRIESGKSMDMDTMMLIMRWLFGDGR